MYKVKCRPWPEIAGFYRSKVTAPQLVWLKPMLALVEQIEHSEYAEKIFGSTSHLCLCISYLPEHEPDKEVLYVSLNHKTGNFELEYVETASSLYKRWKRKCSAEEAFPVFNRFLQQKKWFPMHNSWWTGSPSKAVATWLTFVVPYKTMHNLAVQIVRFVDSYNPGWVECEFVDAAGRLHVLRDKVPIFTAEDLDANSKYPALGSVDSEVVERYQVENGHNLGQLNPTKACRFSQFRRA
jgi:hypothetical protein